VGELKSEIRRDVGRATTKILAEGTNNILPNPLQPTPTVNDTGSTAIKL
jgi:hypothetical protein